MSRVTLALGAAALLLGGAASVHGCTTLAFCVDCEDGGQGGTAGGGGAAVSCDVGCAVDEVCCDGFCSDLDSDAANCGDCGIDCNGGNNASGICVAGECALECAFGFDNCNGLSEDGCEADLASGVTNCGDCDTLCLFAHATPACVSGQCGILACVQGFDDCNDVLADGCEVNLGTDPLNCTTCGNACVAPPNAEPDCLAGNCTFGGCLFGFGDCNLDIPLDGCEVDLTTDAQNCAACGYVCPPLPHATPDCVGAACVIGSCDLGYDDCDASTFDGCETFLATDSEHCGLCGSPCATMPHSYPACVNSACEIGGCESGYADCNGLVADGCEVDLANDVQHCGACLNACPAIANGTPSCTGFACGIGSCAVGFDDCTGGAGDGCETNLMNDVAHCSSCGNVCPAVPFGQRGCDQGTCGVASCVVGRADCNVLPADGCEVDTTTDVAHCNICNNVCPVPPNATPSCVGSVCGLAACNPGFSDCNDDPADGCEFDTLTDPNNCGGCGVKCHSGSCVNAACVCEKTVLVIKDDSDTGTAVLATALGAAGYTVTTSPTPSYQYNGANPALAGFGAVLVLAGGPGASFTTDMPVAGQQALVDFANLAGGGVVLTEWAAYHVAQNRWQTVKPLVLLQRTVAYSGQVTYTVDAAFASHPLWAGLPGSFTFASTSNVGVTKFAPSVLRIAGSPQAIDAVAIRNTGVGRVVHLAHAGNYAPNGWTNANVQRLVTNAVGWVARCP
ncbi:MAG: DUF4350 domain-containing protein [Myxococcales bacterium]|nr:DUF4350 domain-containing protein [Myxococcales bacterium]